MQGIIRAATPSYSAETNGPRVLRNAKVHTFVLANLAEFEKTSQADPREPRA